MTEINYIKKKSGCFNVIFISILLFIGMLIIFNYFINGIDNNKIEKLKENQCSAVWNELNSKQKFEILGEYIDNANKIDGVLENKETIGNAAYSLLTRSVKYPGTIDFGDGTNRPHFSSAYAKIIDIDKGIFVYSESFTAENKLSMKVKGAFEMKIKYNAGCNKFEVLDFEVY